MTLKDFLKSTGVDVTTNKSVLGNQLKGDLALQGYTVDFDKKIEDATDEDLYQVGRSLLLSENKGVVFFPKMIIARMRELICEKTGKID